MLPINWLESADDDLAAIIGYIGASSPIAAERLWQRIRECVLPLAQHPCLHPQSQRIAGTREVVVTSNYVVLYRVTVTAVDIVAVVHAAREFPATDDSHTPGAHAPDRNGVLT